jgi:hypothetical protein
MGRLALLLFLVFAALLVLRALRLLLAAFISARARPTASSTPIEGEMVRDPVCGTWIDRRLALAARSGEEWVPVCSEECRARAVRGPGAPVEKPGDRAGAKGT